MEYSSTESNAKGVPEQSTHLFHESAQSHNSPFWEGPVVRPYFWPHVWVARMSLLAPCMSELQRCLRSFKASRGQTISGAARHIAWRFHYTIRHCSLRSPVPWFSLKRWGDAGAQAPRASCAAARPQARCGYGLGTWTQLSVAVQRAMALSAAGRAWPAASHAAAGNPPF